MRKGKRKNGGGVTSKSSESIWSTLEHILSMEGIILCVLVQIHWIRV